MCALLLLSSCVTQQKYDDLFSDKLRLEALAGENEEDIKVLREKNQVLETEVANLTSVRDQLNEANQDLDSLKSEQNQLQELYDDLLGNSSALNQDLATKQRELLSIEENLAIAKQKNSELNSNLEEREKKVQELEKILRDQERAVSELKSKVSKALLSFKENDLTVKVKNGKVYVSLAEELLFGSGSIDVDSKGKAALQKLSGVLKQQTDIGILVEGHTDNVPISKTSQYMKDNWDLSAMRATSIIRILTQYGVNPKQITAAGKGEFSPLADNETFQGKQTNRRTEIILSPKLDELFQLLED